MADTSLQLIAVRRQVREEIHGFLQQKHPDWVSTDAGEGLEFQLPDSPDLQVAPRLHISLMFMYEEDDTEQE